MRTSRERSCPCNQRPRPHMLRSGFAQRLNEKCSPKNLQTRTNSNLQLLTIGSELGEGVPGRWGQSIKPGCLRLRGALRARSAAKAAAASRCVFRL